MMLRDEDGRFIAAATKTVDSRKDATTVEAMALWEAIKMAKVPAKVILSPIVQEENFPYIIGGKLLNRLKDF